MFCVIGQNIQAAGGAEMLQRIVAEGHTLCNHSTATDMRAARRSRSRRIVDNLQIIRTALGDPNAKVPFFRAPNGSWGGHQNVAVALGMQPLAVVNTISDWETQDIPTLTANLRAAMKPGEIVLAHDGGGTVRHPRRGADGRPRAARRGLDVHAPAARPRPAPGTVVSAPTSRTGWTAGSRATASGPGTVASPPSGPRRRAGRAGHQPRRRQGAGIGPRRHRRARSRASPTSSAWVRFARGPDRRRDLAEPGQHAAAAPRSPRSPSSTDITNSGWTQVTGTFTMAAADTALLYFETP